MSESFCSPWQRSTRYVLSGVWWILQNCSDILHIQHSVSHRYFHPTSFTFPPFLFVYAHQNKWCLLSFFHAVPIPLEWCVCGLSCCLFSVTAVCLHVCKEGICWEDTERPGPSEKTLSVCLPKSCYHVCPLHRWALCQIYHTWPAADTRMLTSGHCWEMWNGLFVVRPLLSFSTQSEWR